MLITLPRRNAKDFPKARPCWTRSAISLAFACYALAAQVSCANDVYRWQDAEGRTHYSDRTAPGAAKLHIRGAGREAAPEYAMVIKVYDGDTLTLAGGEKVRLLGINTPEIRGRRSDGEAGGQEARRWLADRLQGRRVRLETDETRRDKYDRLLAHVFADDGTHINLSLVELGLATTDIFPPNGKYVDALIAAEHRAELARRGIWGLSEYQPKAPSALHGESPEGWQRIRGTPKQLEAGRNYQRIRFADAFELHVPKESVPLFPPLEQYLGKALEARGWVFCRRHGGCSMLVRHPSAIMIPGASPAAPP